MADPMESGIKYMPKLVSFPRVGGAVSSGFSVFFSHDFLNIKPLKLSEWRELKGCFLVCLLYTVNKHKHSEQDEGCISLYLSSANLFHLRFKIKNFLKPKVAVI